MLSLLLGLTVANSKIQPLTDVIPGIWNITRVSVTKNGRENPDVMNFSIEFFAEELANMFTGSFMRLLPDKSWHREHEISIALGKNETMFDVAIDGSNVLSEEIDKSIDGIRNVHTALESSDKTIAFVLLSSYRAELTIFDRSSDEVILYRAMKQYESERLNAFGKILSYFVRKSVFRFI